MTKPIPLTQLDAGRRATVVEIQAGQGLVRRLEALGVRVGRQVEKISGPFIRGPVTVKVGNIRAAIGFGAASKVLVSTQEQKP